MQLLYACCLHTYALAHMRARVCTQASAAIAGVCTESLNPNCPKLLPSQPSLRSITGAYLDAYSTQVMPGAALAAVYESAAQDMWQYHTVMTVAAAHSTATPGRTFVAQVQILKSAFCTLCA